jgi:hypothetical protein
MTGKQHMHDRPTALHIQEWRGRKCVQLSYNVENSNCEGAWIAMKSMVVPGSSVMKPMAALEKFCSSNAVFTTCSTVSYHLRSLQRPSDAL